MIDHLILSALARLADRIVIENLHRQMQGYNARLAPKSPRNEQLISAFTGTIKKIPARKSRARR